MTMGRNMAKGDNLVVVENMVTGITLPTRGENITQGENISRGENMIRGRKHDKSPVFSIHLYLLFICFPSQGYHFCSFLPSLSFFLFLSYSVCVGV